MCDDLRFDMSYIFQNNILYKDTFFTTFMRQATLCEIARFGCSLCGREFDKREEAETHIKFPLDVPIPPGLVFESQIYGNYASNRSYIDINLVDREFILADHHTFNQQIKSFRRDGGECWNPIFWINSKKFKEDLEEGRVRYLDAELFSEFCEGHKDILLFNRADYPLKKDSGFPYFFTGLKPEDFEEVMKRFYLPCNLKYGSFPLYRDRFGD